MDNDLRLVLVGGEGKQSDAEEGVVRVTETEGKQLQKRGNSLTHHHSHLPAVHACMHFLEWISNAE